MSRRSSEPFLEVKTLQPNFELKSTLTAEELIMFESEMKWRTKSGPLAFVLWWFLGWFGAHHFYLGRWAAAIGQLVLAIAVAFLNLTGVARVAINVAASEVDMVDGLVGQVFSGPGIMTWIGMLLGIVAGIWWFVSAFFIPLNIRRHAYKTEEQLVPEIVKLRTMAAGAVEQPVAESAVVSPPPPPPQPVTPTAAPVPAPAPAAPATEAQQQTSVPAAAVQPPEQSAPAPASNAQPPEQSAPAPQTQTVSPAPEQSAPDPEVEAQSQPPASPPPPSTSDGGTAASTD